MEEHDNSESQYTEESLVVESSGSIGRVPEGPLVSCSEAGRLSPSGKESPIQNKYSFWYMKRTAASKTESYEKCIKKIGTFNKIESFWSIYGYLIRPGDVPNTTDYHLFKDGIKPMWEDTANRRGGKWMVRVKKGISSRYWEDLILAIIGEQFDVGNEICGAVMSIRYNEDIISLWNRNADNNEACYKIRDNLRRVLKLPQFVAMEYKRHDASLNDNSSFRNTTVWRSNRAGGNGNPNETAGGNSGNGAKPSSRERDVTPTDQSNRRDNSRKDRDDREWTRGGGWDREKRDSKDRRSHGDNVAQEGGAGDRPW